MNIRLRELLSQFISAEDVKVICAIKDLRHGWLMKLCSSHSAPSNSARGRIRQARGLFHPCIRLHEPAVDLRPKDSDFCDELFDSFSVDGRSEIHLGLPFLITPKTLHIGTTGRAGYDGMESKWQ